MNLIQLMETVRAFMPAQIILTAHRMGVFAALGTEGGDVVQVAERLAASVRGTGILLDALCALGLLIKQGGHYRNAQTVLDHLLPDSPAFKGATLSHFDTIMAEWMALEQAVRAGCTVRPPERNLVGQESLNRQFIGAMAEIGRPNGRIIAQHLDLSPFSKLLDLGGGPGVFAQEILRKNPQMRAVVADLPITLNSARPIVESSGFAERIDLLPADFYQDEQADLGEGYDLVLISNVLHVEGEAQNRRLLTKVFTVMVPGGMILIHEGIIDDNRVTPPDRALFAVNMLVNTERGNCYTFNEMKEWLEEAGFTKVEFVDCFQQPSLLIAKKE